MSFGISAPPSRVVYPLLDSMQRRQKKNSNDTWHEQVRLYNATGGALTTARVYRVTLGGTTATAQNPRVTAPANLTDVQSLFVVAMEAVADTAWGWFGWCGYVDVGVEGTTDVDAGHWITAVDGQTYAARDGAGTAQTVKSLGIALAAQAANSVVTTRCFLLGHPIVLEA